MFEAAALGGLGLVVAGALGGTLGAMWVETTFPALLGWTLILHVPTAHLVGIALAVSAVCTAAAVVPSMHVSRVAPAAALRAE